MELERIWKHYKKLKYEKNLKKYEKKETLINLYIELLMAIIETNKILYDLTELYENEYMLDFQAELWQYFKNNLGFYSRKINKLNEILKNYNGGNINE